MKRLLLSFLLVMFLIPAAAAQGTLTIANGTLKLQNGAILSTPLHWTDNGTFEPGNGIVIFNGTGDQQLTCPGGEGFRNLTVDNPSGDFVLADNVSVSGTLRITKGDLDLNGIDLSPAAVKDLDRLCLVACGTAYYSCMVGKYLYEQIARLPVEVDLASEFRYRKPILDPRVLVVPVSQSGETADTLAALRQGRESGSRVLSICNVRDSTIARLIVVPASISARTSSGEQRTPTDSASTTA